MSYQQITEVADNTPPAQQTPAEETIDLTVAVFFDGTNNNKDNVIAPADENRYNNSNPLNTDNDSYSGTWSNIAELWDVYVADEKTPDIKKFYIEGAGTVEVTRETIKDKNGNLIEKNHYYDDEKRGYAWGTGPTGVNAKVEKACKRIAEYVEKMCKKKGVKAVGTLTLDVFGFSRGATAARSFVHRIYPPEGTIMPNETVLCMSPKINTEGKSVFLPNPIIEKGYQVNKYVVRFLGLFDTVSSYSPGATLSEFDNDVEELNLDIPKSKDRNKFEIQKVLHLVAADEYREYFSLINIDSAVRQGKGEEWILPGCHADIGGGYLQTEKEMLIMERAEFSTLPTSNSYNVLTYRGYKSKQALLDEGWITAKQYKQISEIETGEQYKAKKASIHSKYPKENASLRLEQEPNPQSVYTRSKEGITKLDPSSSDWEMYFELLRELYPFRLVDYQYSYIPLHIMYSQATIKGMQFNADSQKSSWKEIPPTLQTLYARLQSIGASPIYRLTPPRGISFMINTPDPMVTQIRNQYIHLSSYNREAMASMLRPYSPVRGESWYDLRRIIHEG